MENIPESAYVGMRDLDIQRVKELIPIKTKQTVVYNYCVNEHPSNVFGLLVDDIDTIKKKVRLMRCKYKKMTKKEKDKTSFLFIQKSFNSSLRL